MVRGCLRRIRPSGAAGPADEPSNPTPDRGQPIVRSKRGGRPLSVVVDLLSAAWSPWSPWLRGLVDASIGAACLAIAVALWIFVRRRSDLPFRGVLALLGGLVLTAAVTVLSGRADGSEPGGVEAVARGVLAAISIGTALVMGACLRRALAQAGPEELAAANQKLRAEIGSRLIAEGELKLHASRLEKARDEAQSANRAKSEFLANMSHEIRTPLNAVIGLTEALLSTNLTEHQREYLRTVLDSGNQLLGVINDILDFSKIGAGKVRLERVSFNLDDALGDTLRSFSARAAGKGIELAYRISPDVPRNLIGDPLRLRQVITNLVSNALTFTDEGVVSVRVCREPTGPHLHLRFSVEDTGHGIDPEEVERLFAAFEQADASSSRRHGGTGLGLSICRGLVQLLEGHLGAVSTPGKGSTFYFTGRFDAEPDVDAPVYQALHGLPILIVDDDETSRNILSDIVRRQRMLPVAASSAAKGFAVLEERAAAGDRIPLVLTDLTMPDADGFDLVTRIREREEFDGVEVLLLTANVGAADLDRCEELGIHCHLPKPVKEYELLGAISRALCETPHPTPGAARTDGEHPRPEVREVAPEPVPDGQATPPLRILLVEDSVPNQKVALAILGGWGHTVIVASDGQEALSLFRSRGLDVVLMDVQMPLMDGFQCTAAIRAAEAQTGKHVPIIAMTAHALTGDREKCLASGMDDYVSKPIRREYLLRVLSGVAAKRAPAR